jgi:hypothetical protein
MIKKAKGMSVHPAYDGVTVEVGFDASRCNFRYEGDTLVLEILGCKPAMPPEGGWLKVDAVEWVLEHGLSVEELQDRIADQVFEMQRFGLVKSVML